MSTYSPQNSMVTFRLKKRIEVIQWAKSTQKRNDWNRSTQLNSLFSTDRTLTISELAGGQELATVSKTSTSSHICTVEVKGLPLGALLSMFHSYVRHFCATVVAVHLQNAASWELCGQVGQQLVTAYQLSGVHLLAQIITTTFAFPVVVPLRDRRLLKGNQRLNSGGHLLSWQSHIQRTDSNDSLQCESERESCGQVCHRHRLPSSSQLEARRQLYYCQSGQQCLPDVPVGSKKEMKCTAEYCVSRFEGAWPVAARAQSSPIDFEQLRYQRKRKWEWVRELKGV